jgi:hypothetical protein
MFDTRRKPAPAGWLAVAAMVLAVQTAHTQDRRPPDARPATTQVQGVVRAVDAGKSSITVTTGTRGRGAPQEKTFTLAKDAEVLLDNGRGSRFVLKEGKLADVHPGAVVTLTLTSDGKRVESLVAEGPTIQGTAKTVDAGKNTLTLTTAPAGRGEEGVEKNYKVSKDAEIALDDGRGRRFSLKEGKLGDVQPGSVVTLKLSIDQKTVESIIATGPIVAGVVKSVDATANTITLTTGRGRGEETQEKTFTLVKGVDVVLDDSWRGRRFVKAGKLADLPAGALAFVKLSLDQKTGVLVRAEGPTVSGTLKRVDADRQKVTVLVGAGRGSDGEEKTFTLARGARVFLDGKPVTLDDLGKLKASADTPVSLNLSLDRKVVNSLRAFTQTRR